VKSLYHLKTSTLIEYPFEYRIVSVFDKFLDVSLVRLTADDLAAASLVPEWFNEWIEE
jgi:hypothetical protein